MTRFTQPDPSGQEKNPYLYAEGDPVNRIDPSGLFSLGGFLKDTIGGTLIGAAGGCASGAVGSIWTGPGALVGCGIGAATGALGVPSRARPPTYGMTSPSTHRDVRSTWLGGHGPVEGWRWISLLLSPAESAEPSAEALL
ncbi:RHS repeat-associated core domain-containing protein [Streptomyces aureocirculatus]